MNVREALRLYFLMGSPNCGGRDPRVVLQEAIEGGVTLFQFREKGERCLVGAKKRELALDLKAICHAEGIPFIVNDDVDLAVEVDADGIHIGQDDGSVEAARRKIGDAKILGVSTHNLAEAQNAVRAGADYIGVGPMFMTKTKPDAKEVKGPKVIESIRTHGITLPIVGIGGIQASNAREVVEAGADGVAVISAISQADDVKEAAQRFQVLTRLARNIR